MRRLLRPGNVIAIAILGVTCVLAIGIVRWSYGSVGAFRAVVAGHAAWVEQPNQWLGTLEVDQERIVPFQVRNLADEPIAIQGSASDCSCAVAQNLPLTIPANESGEICVVVHPAPAQAGKPFRQTVALYVDAMESPVRLEVSGLVAGVSNAAK